MLKGKKILIGITGSIAAYKIPLLIRALVREGADVQVILTENARDFITPLTLSTLTNRPALTYPFDESDGTWNSHVEMGNWADLMLIAPASASTMSKMVSGNADNLLLTTYLAAKCPVFFAPAMDLDMYRHPSTTANIKKLVSYGNKLIQPGEGELASGLCGAGRLEEPENILEYIKKYFESNRVFQEKKFLISAGPTYEAIDPVRFIGNHSSGLMGFALAKKATEMGAEVILVSGPTHLNIEDPLITKIDVVSASEMYDECTENFSDADVTIMSAAVADYSPVNPAGNKLKKDNSIYSIELKPTKDILAALGKEKRTDQILVGFALETDNETENAIKKLNNKNLDIIVLNSLKDKGAGFGRDTNKITLIEKNGKQTSFELKSKTDVALDILNKIVEYI